MIIFIGVAGSGKSMQGRLLADELAVPWLSTGEFLRMLISGERRKDMVAGKLLKDQDIISLVRKIFTIIDVGNEFVLDGFPRTPAQADWLLNQVKHGQLSSTVVIHLKASSEIIKERLLQRGRKDDYKEAIDERLLEYEQLSVPIIKNFKEAGIMVYDINGEETSEKVHQQILEAVEKAHSVYANKNQV
ncbi:nucleoside monophosphate kinase [Candidatus Saccharibacteria bacterium]|nr:nucleoside monophosphate kinase [Candidatus Saccharibacteria bacterium]MBI3337736.1 nucleoside monophosphate kinase [Candidatus Saccharibacteria bacterium]